MKYFESILTAKQKKTFEKIKQEQMKKWNKLEKITKDPNHQKAVILLTANAQ